MRVNFFVLFPTATMVDAPVSYIAAYRAPDVAGFDNAISRDFPNITSIDVSASIAQVQRVLDQVVRAVEFLFGFTLAAGLVVLFAAVSATRESRAREFAVMRALGASGKLLAQVQRAELLGVGALAGLLASIAAIAVSWALARYVFEFSWNPSPLVPLLGASAGAVLALAAGWWGLREVLTRPVVHDAEAGGGLTPSRPASSRSPTDDVSQGVQDLSCSGGAAARAPRPRTWLRRIISGNACVRS